VIGRRNLLSAILIAGAAPVYVKAGILMPVRKVWTPEQRLILCMYEIRRIYREHILECESALQLWRSKGKAFPEGSWEQATIDTQLQRLAVQNSGHAEMVDRLSLTIAKLPPS
jgi:hypothetical protein